MSYLENYINDYKHYLLSKGLSKATYDAYISDLDRFMQYCTSVGVKNPNQIDLTGFNNYINQLKIKNLSNSSINRNISSAKSFSRFLFKEGIIKTDVLSEYKPVFQNSELPQILDRNEVVKLLDAPKGNSVKSKRDKVLLELLYATGMKVSELIELTTGDINLRFNIVKINSEKHERTVPIYPEAARHLSEYIKIYRPAISANNTELLFTNLNGNRLSRQGVWKIIKQYAGKIGIEKTITPHTLRHSFAVHLLENGADINDIKEMMGHLDISSTMFYSNLLKNKFSRGYAIYHPLAKK